MIAFVNGILEDIYLDHVVIDVNGIGYNVNISSYTLSLLPAIGCNIKLYTYTQVREDAFLLFGFLTKNELGLFKQLITVNGVGPKAGLSILSIADPDEIKYAILSSDVKFISKAPGIGKKTAERLVLDLKDKLNYDTDIIQREININSASITLDSDIKNEALDALIALGYSSNEAHKAVKNVILEENMDVEDILKEALKVLL